MTYNWMQFNLRDALAGVMVGFRNNSDSTDISATGVLREPGPNYKLEFGGYKMLVDSNGLVKECKPAKYSGQQLMMVTTSMGDELEAGTAAKGRARQNSQGQYVTDDNVTLASLQPRDHFALHVLNAMLIHADHPENFDDANCMRYASAAYRFAQAMMIVAAGTRYGQSTEQSSMTADVRTEDLENNTEKLLYNISQYMKNGVAVKGETDVTIKGTPHVAIEGTPNVSVSNTPNVNVSNTPNVNVANTPNVNVTNMPENLATKADVDSAKNSVILAMPQCKYTPPSEDDTPGDGGGGGSTEPSSGDSSDSGSNSGT